MTSSSTEPRARAVQNYDFRRPRRLSLEQMRNIQRLLSSAAEELQGRLAQFLGLSVHVRLEAAEEVAYGLMQAALPDHSYAALLDLSPLPERGIFILETPLCLSFVDRVLGGHCKASPKGRALTAIDQAAVDLPMELLLRTLREAWKDACVMKLSVISRHNDARLISVIPTNEPALVATWAITGDLGESRMRLCLPINTLKHHAAGAPRLAATQTGGEKADVLRARVMQSVEKVALRVEAIIGHAELPIGQLLTLAPGDVVPLHESSEHPVLIKVGGNAAYRGKMGLQGRRKAVRVIDRIDPNEE